MSGSDRRLGTKAVLKADGSPMGRRPPTSLRKLYTEHIGQLIGTQRTPLAPLGLVGTDLGASFVQSGQLVFLFGDCWTVDGNNWNDDSAALGSLAYPTDGSVPALTWLRQPSGRFLPLAVVGIDLGAMNVPVEGIAVGATTYLFFTAGYSATTHRHTHSVLAHTTGAAFQSLSLDHSVPSDRFLNVSVVVEEHTTYIFGSGPYRQSAIYLARTDLASLADRMSWSYFGGMVSGVATFVSDERDAVPMITSNCVGELSVRKHPGLGLYLMAYNCDSPRGVHFRFAPSALGPWSDPEIIFDPNTDHGYQYFIHAKASEIGFDDGLSDMGREEEWGGEYGPYLVPEWFSLPGIVDPPGTFSIVYVLSSWNPYRVHLMRTMLGEPGATASPLARGLGLVPARLENADFATGDLSGWQSSGDPFSLFVGSDGRYRLTTYVPPAGDAAVGQLWQDFTIDAQTSELRFFVHGGDATVKLIHNGDVVCSTRGRRKNDVETEVRWRLESYRGETVRLLIDDNLTTPWGFVGTSGFELR